MSILFEHAPEGFSPTVDVCGCAFVQKGRVLLLERSPQKPYGGTWGLPAGKREVGEDLPTCLQREVQEETGVTLDMIHVQPLGKLYWMDPKLHFTFHVYGMNLQGPIDLQINLIEHLRGAWVTFDEALTLPLIPGGREVIFYLRKQWPELF